jgi:microcystin degradation protein MlrC
MRVGVIALLHESNTFVSQPTTLRHFEEELLVTGDAVRTRLAEAHHEVGGFFQGLQDAKIQAVPVFAARATPFGAIESAAYSRLLEILFAALEDAGALDGVLVAPHGATVSEEVLDADGHWLSLLRDRVGAKTPILGTLDPHANLSPAMLAATNALIAYRTNPHLDQRECGVQAAQLMARTLRGEVRPVQAAAAPPMAIDIERQCTSESPCRPLYDIADRMLDLPGVLSNSIVLGFPYADVPEMGSAALVVTDDNAPLAQRLANELGEYLWQHRWEFIGEHLDIETAVNRAVLGSKASQVAGESVRYCLLDMGDNVGGGSPGDGTALAHALHKLQHVNSFICLYDPQAVRRVEAACVGDSFPMQVGGKTDRLHGEPLEARFTVLGVYEGRFHETQPRHGGWTEFDMGRTAVVRTENGLTVMLTSRRVAPFSLEQLRCCNLDPTRFHILVAKGVNAPIAAYRDVCDHFLRVNTPGVTTADMTRLPFQHRRRPMFPFEK